MLLYMFPLFFADNRTNTSPTEIKHFSKFILRIISRFIKYSYLNHILFCYFSRTTSRTENMIGSIFSIAIHPIIFLCAQKKMIRITTSGFITGMKNIKSIWNRPISYFPRNYMSTINYLIDIKFSITISIFQQSTRLPHPAIIYTFNINLFPKAFFHRFGFFLQEKMLWICTRRISTMMLYAKSFWDWSISQLPCNIMGLFQFLSNSKLSIFTKRRICFPFPAIIRLLNINLFPKAFFNRFISFRHIASLIGAAPGKTDFLLQSSVPGGDINKNIRFAKLCSEFIIPHLGWSSC